MNLIVVLSFFSAALNAVATAVLPLYFPDDPPPRCKGVSRVNCKDLALRALVGLELLQATVTPSNPSHCVATSEVLAWAHISQHTVSEEDYTCVSTYVRTLLHKIYLDERVYDVLVQINQTSGESSTTRVLSKNEFIHLWSTQKPKLSRNVSNICIAFDWYKFVIEPIAERSLGDMLVGRITCPSINALAPVVIPYPTAVVRLITVARSSLIRSIENNVPSVIRKPRIIGKSADDGTWEERRPLKKPKRTKTPENDEWIDILIEQFQDDPSIVK